MRITRLHVAGEIRMLDGPVPRLTDGMVARLCRRLRKDFAATFLGWGI